MIKLENIHKTYYLGDEVIRAVDGIDLGVADGEMVSIMGTSGSGKTTLMNILGLLDQPTSGKYFLDGKEVSYSDSAKLAHLRNRTIGFVFQQFYLLPRLNALQNVMLPLTYRNMSIGEMKENALASLEKMNMEKFINHRPSQLSGGQQQRVAIARALVGDPRFILADEPTGSLDSKTGQDVMNLLIKINKVDKGTVVVVTHDINIAKQCPRIITVSDGKIVESKTTRLPGFVPSKKNNGKNKK